jgi:hypothetical protein
MIIMITKNTFSYAFWGFVIIVIIFNIVAPLSIFIKIIYY